MAARYTVWVQIERSDEQPEHVENVALPDNLATYTTEEAAQEYVLGLLLASPDGDASTSDQVPDWFRTATTR